MTINPDSSTWKVYGTTCDEGGPLGRYFGEDTKRVIMMLAILPNVPMKFEDIKIDREPCHHCHHPREPATPIKVIEDLRYYGLVDVENAIRSTVSLTEMGGNYLRNRLPEEELWSLLPRPINDIPMDQTEKGVAIGILKKLGAIKIENGIVTKNNVDTYLSYILDVRDSLTGKELNRELIGRKLLSVTDTTERMVKITDKGLNVYSEEYIAMYWLHRLSGDLNA